MLPKGQLILKGAYMFEGESFDDIEIYWDGWSTTFKQLHENGWQINKVKAYVCGSRATPIHHEWNSRTKIYIRNPEARLMGRITYYPEMEGTKKRLVLDFLTPDKLVLGRVKKWIWEDLDESDVPDILDKLATLADKTTVKKLPEKEVVKFKKKANEKDI